MRALVITEATGPDAARLVDDAAEPQGAHTWADGERLLVRVRAAAVAFPDLLQSKGEYQHSPEPPYAVGGEFAGLVVEAPPGSRFAVGDRVAGLSVHGAIAERVLAIPRYTVKLPDHVSWVDGAAFFLNYATAWFTLSRAGFADGESVLVHGAAGGVGTAVLDLLRGRARPLVAVVSSQPKAEVAARAGADVVLTTDVDWSARARDLTGTGVDVVIDPVGGDRFTDSLRALDIGGRLMVVGFAAGSIPQVKVNRLLLRDLAVVGVALEPWVRRHPRTAAELIAALESALAERRVSPVVDRVLPFARADQALGILERREAIGKVVVTIEE